MRRILIPLLPIAIALSVAFRLISSVSATTWDSPFSVADPAKRADVAIDSIGELHLIWWNPDRLIIQYRHCAAANTCDPVETLPKLDGDSYAPALAVDSLNRPTVVWEQKKGKKHTIYLARRDGVWSAPVALSDQPDSILPDIAIGPDDMSQVVYESVEKNARAIYYVTVSGSLTSHSRLVDLERIENARKVTGGRNVRIAVDGDNNPHLVWNLARRPFGVMYTWASGGIFAFPKIVADNAEDQTPDISIDPETNRVGIVWETRKNNHAAFLLLQDHVQVFRQNNVEGGFDTVRRPRIAADCGGRFHIVWQLEKSNQSDWNIFYRQFEPGGNIFTNPLRLTDSQKDDALPALAAGDFALVGYTTGKHGALKAQGGAIGGTCHGDPTPTPTLSPTIPAPTWEHVPNDDARIIYTKPWKKVDASQATDGNLARCGNSDGCKKNSSAEFVFEGGTRLEWETVYANNYGKADVYLDGRAYEVIDFCKLNPKSSKPKFGVRTYVLRGDATTRHSIKIVATGHSGCSDANKDFVAVDGFNVLR